MAVKTELGMSARVAEVASIVQLLSDCLFAMFTV